MRLFLFILLTFCFSASSLEESIALSVGFDTDFSFEEEWKGKKLTFGGTYKKVTSLNYDSSRNFIRFTPKKRGVSSLVVKEGNKILKKYTISVQETDLNQVAHEIKSLLGEIDGIEIIIINNKVVVDGEIFIPRDIRRISNVVSQYGKKAVSLVTLSVSAQNKVAQFIEREIGNPNITVKAANETFILRGTVSNPKEKEDAFIITQLYVPDVVLDPSVGKAIRERVKKQPIINLIQVKLPPKKEAKQNKLVQLIVHYVELDKDYTDQFRFQWAPKIEDSTKVTFGSQIGSVIAGTISNFVPKLNWAKQFGFARVLNSSNIIVENGETGNISSTTEIPFGVLTGADGSSQPTTTNETIQLEITPTIVGAREDGVRLSLSFQMRALAGVTGGKPIMNQRSIKTKVYVRSGLSAAVGGIISSTNTQGFNREPAGSNNSEGDPIFNLLSSKAFQRKKNQFVMFVTPVIRSSASTDVEEIKQKFRIER